jgi:hypothetical protein
MAIGQTTSNQIVKHCVLTAENLREEAAEMTDESQDSKEPA